MISDLVDVTKKTFEYSNRNMGEIGHVYIVDTNIVHGFPEAIEILAQENQPNESPPNIIVLPDIVTRELSGLKRSQDHEKAIDARKALNGVRRYLIENGERKIDSGDYNLGFKFPKGSVLLFLPYVGDTQYFPDIGHDADSQIISCALGLREGMDEKHRERISIVSDDADIHVKCFRYKMPSSEFKEFHTEHEYTGFVEIDLHKHMEKGSQIAQKIYDKLRKGPEIPTEMVEELIQQKLLPNQFVRFLCEAMDPKDCYRVLPEKNTATRKLYHKDEFLRKKLESKETTIYQPTWEQNCALELLADPSIDLVTLSGPPGGGKTMLPLDVAYHMVLDGKNPIRSILASNPPIDSPFGYLPGDKDEKLIPQNQNIIDALHFLLGRDGKQRKDIVDEQIEEMIRTGDLELEATTFIKGRTLNDRFLHFEEAEDFPTKQMRKIVTRAGRNSKMVICGDPDQVDNPKCSVSRNGLVYLIYKFKGEPSYGHVTIANTAERSELAKLAIELKL